MALATSSATKNSSPGGTHAIVAAGSTIDLQWTNWPDGHHGPVIDYLANCNGDCETVDKTSLSFFKIDEAGLINGSPAPGTWSSDKLIANNNTWSLTIPSSIAPGNYVLRHEIIALHSAQNADGAQNYPQCFNLQVTGSGTVSPAGIPATKLYTANDPGILVNIYYPALTNYTIPGPPLFDGSTSSSPPADSNSTKPATSSSAGGAAVSSKNSTTASNIPASLSASASRSTLSTVSTKGASAVSSTASHKHPLSNSTTTVAAGKSSAAVSARPTTVTTDITVTLTVTILPGSSISTLPFTSPPHAVVETTTLSSSSPYITPTTTDDDAGSFPTTLPVDSVIASLSTALPSAVLTSAAPTVTASSDNGSTFSTEGLTIAQLLDILKEVISALRTALGSSVGGPSRRHARDVRV